MDEKQKVLGILNKFSFILGQRAGRELWFDKPENVQDEDLLNFNRDIEYIKNYIENSNQTVWHKVADGDLPKNDTIVLAFYKPGYCATFLYLKNADDEIGWWCGASKRFDKDIIAWTDLPEYKE